jgi:acetyl esterase/lipase
MTGMVPTMAGFDRACLTNQEPKVAGIVNWYGITDVADLLDAPGKDPFPWTTNRPFAVQWLGNQPNREEIAKAASPMTYVRAGLPPIISVQGDADPTVPYRHNVQLHQALAKAGVRNEFVTIPKGLHGGFPLDQQQRAFAAIAAFLNANGLGAPKAPAGVAAAAR